MSFNIEDFQEIKKTKGGRRDPIFSINRSGYFRMNNNFIDKYSLKDMKFVQIKAIKEEDKIVLALKFTKEENVKYFGMSYHKESRSFNFSGSSIFATFGLRSNEVIKEKTIIFEPKIQKEGEEEYFIVEIPLSKD